MPASNDTDKPDAGRDEKASSAPRSDDQRAQHKIDPRDSPVDVPRTPSSAPREDVASQESRPRHSPDAGTSWADTAEPAPNKRTARSNPY